MKTATGRNWQDIHTELMRRIRDRIWKPGELVPHESDLALEFGCARATVNRAMQEIAEAGFVERKRKAGTSVTVNPVRKAVLSIPVTRLEIEGRGFQWSQQVLERQLRQAPLSIAKRMQTPAGKPMLHLRSVHFADYTPWLYEDRWINPQTVPEVMRIDFSTISANEWLVGNAPFSRGDIALGAVNASAKEALILATNRGMALFVIERTTWHGKNAITHVRLTYAPGHTLQTSL